MATAGAAVGLGLSSSFVSGHRKLKPKGRRRWEWSSSSSSRKGPSSMTVAAGMGLELIADLLHPSGGRGEHLFLGVGVGLPCTVMECGDIIYRSTLPRSNGLTITAPGVALALSAVSYLWATPGVAPGFWDMFILAFLERVFRPTYRKA